MAAFGISQVIFQPSMSAKRSPWLRMNPQHTCRMQGRTRVMTVTGLMAGIPLRLPVCRWHPRPCTPSGRLCSAAAGKPRWVQEEEAGICQSLGAAGWHSPGLGEEHGGVLEGGRGTVPYNSTEYWHQCIWGAGHTAC